MALWALSLWVWLLCPPTLAAARMTPRWDWDAEQGSGGRQGKKPKRPRKVQAAAEQRRTPKGRRQQADMQASAAGEVTDELVGRLIEGGYMSEVVAELKSGKEATAYVARVPAAAGGEQAALLKIYHDAEARDFAVHDLYLGGRETFEQQVARAFKHRNRRGLSLSHVAWVMAEYAHLWRLWRAGLSVPEPLVGPAMRDYAATVPAVLMRLVGSEDAPAPRLSDAALSEAEARAAWEQAVQGMADLLRLGLVHGDYSTYNLLWHAGEAVMIDVPQLSTRRNPQFETLLARDAESLSKSFRVHGIATTGDETLREVRRRAAAPSPLVPREPVP